MAALYLIPTPLGDTPLERVIPSENAILIRSLSHFVVEDLRSARRFLKRIDRSWNIDEIGFTELNEHTLKSGVEQLLDPLLRGFDLGVLSDAGCPGVADPGADLARLAHERGFEVRPLAGPSSILLSLMGSGMNGQHFTFLGYLPVKPAERNKAIRDLEGEARRRGITQIFIEAPYRNNQLVTDLLATCSDQTRLCIAVDLTLETQMIETRTIAAWRRALPDLHKRPAIFLIG